MKAINLALCSALTLTLMAPWATAEPEKASEPVTTDSLSLSITPVALEAHLLKKHYDAYQITLRNDGAGSWVVKNSDLGSSLGGEQAYKACKKSVFGWSSFLGVSGLVVSTVRRQIKNAKAKDESKTFEAALGSNPVEAGEEIQTRILVPKNTCTTIKVTALRAQDNQSLTLEQPAPCSAPAS